MPMIFYSCKRKKKHTQTHHQHTATKHFFCNLIFLSILLSIEWIEEGNHVLKKIYIKFIKLNKKNEL